VIVDIRRSEAPWSIVSDEVEQQRRGRAPGRLRMRHRDSNMPDLPRGSWAAQLLHADSPDAPSSAA
jgi:hypothetical protein